MTYNQLCDLKAMGYIEEKDEYSITEAGKIAVI